MIQNIRVFALLSVVTVAAVALLIGGCDKKTEPAQPVAGAGGSAKSNAHDHKDGHGHDHGDDHDHGPTTQLGELSADGFLVKASRDGGIKAGGDAPIDVWVTGGTVKVAAVRFWIGTQDAKGSLKAKAEIEKDNWHTHAEIPNPLPESSKLWVEIEADNGQKTLVGFDLKQ